MNIKPELKIIKDSYIKALCIRFDLTLDQVEKDVRVSAIVGNEWSKGSLIEIYCEQDIPNASDFFDPLDWGMSGCVVYNSDKWNEVDKLANDFIRARTFNFKSVYHEPYNNAVVVVNYL